jgi:hypothetical protein
LTGFLRNVWTLDLFEVTIDGLGAEERAKAALDQSIALPWPVARNRRYRAEPQLHGGEESLEETRPSIALLPHSFAHHCFHPRGSIFSALGGGFNSGRCFLSSIGCHFCPLCCRVRSLGGGCPGIGDLGLR